MKMLNWYLREMKRKNRLAFSKVRFVIRMMIKPIGTKFEISHRRVNRFVYIHSILRLLETA